MSIDMPSQRQCLAALDKAMEHLAKAMVSSVESHT